MISGIDMFGSYPEYALLKKQYTKITQEEFEDLSKKRDVFVHLMKQGPNNLLIYNGFYTASIFYFEILAIIVKRNPDFDAYYMPGHSNLDNSYLNFLNSTGVKKYLQVRNDNFVYMNQTIEFNFGKTDYRIDVSPLIGRMLDDGVRVIVVDGEDDFVCNYQQSEKSFTTMEWSGKKEWSKVERKPCKYGLCKEYKNLKQIRVPGSGHGISVYKPEIGLKLINEFMFGAKEL